ncbi:DUF3499 family protein [Agromyces sp. SYSU T0242]|uniref:DUF3499 family protein n=1 Tax=Agromyces litoreus TaxID=3158561 RepID=UPI003399CACE
MRRCSRTACTAEAVATLTYDYADSLAVLGPLSLVREPHSYDLCAVHAGRTSAPRGWQVIRHATVGEVGFTA